MPSRSRVVATCAATALALLVASAPAAAAPKRITGKLSKPGLTVIALAGNGEASLDRPRRRKFSLRPPAETVTLHLRARDGTYAGPIVVARRKNGRRAIVGVAAGTKLGRVNVKTAKGFAKVKRRVPMRLLDEEREARARKGRPIGNGRNFGRVKTKHTRNPAPGDRDRDGVPNHLDVDDDGDLILDKVDRGGRRRARAAAGTNEFGLATVFAPGGMDEWTNANAANLTDADIDRALANEMYLIFEIAAVGAELDCGGAPDPTSPTGWSGGLSYCTMGGTGHAFGDPDAPSFPECCDADGDGFGTLPNNSPDFPDPGFNFFSPGATSAEIGTGDVLVQRVTSGGSESQFVTLLPFVFATVPALISYDDGRGNSATINYPAPSTMPPGSRENPFPVKAHANGDVLVTMTFWRPQRRPIPPESGEWVDMGGLSYSAKTHFTAQPGCPQGAFSENDPNLAPADSPLPDGPGGVIDLAADQPANPANTFTLTLNLTECRANHGTSFDPGERVDLSFHGVAYGGPDEGSTRGQTNIAVSFERQP